MVFCIFYQYLTGWDGSATDTVHQYHIYTALYQTVKSARILGHSDSYSMTFTVSCITDCMTSVAHFPITQQLLGLDPGHVTVSRVLFLFWETWQLLYWFSSLSVFLAATCFCLRKVQPFFFFTRILKQSEYCLYNAYQSSMQYKYCTCMHLHHHYYMFSCAYPVIRHCELGRRIAGCTLKENTQRVTRSSHVDLRRFLLVLFLFSCASLYFKINIISTRNGRFLTNLQLSYMKRLLKTVAEKTAIPMRYLYYSSLYSPHSPMQINVGHMRHHSRPYDITSRWGGLLYELTSVLQGRT